MPRIQLRRGSVAEWTASNPVLADGEPGFALPDGPLKIGNGVDPWLDLPEAEGGLSEAEADTRYVAIALAADDIHYNSDGSVQYSIEGGVRTDYTWNSDGTCHTETSLGKVKTWSYDSNGNPTTSTVTAV